MYGPLPRHKARKQATNRQNRSERNAAERAIHVPLRHCSVRSTSSAPLICSQFAGKVIQGRSGESSHQFQPGDPPNPVQINCHSRSFSISSRAIVPIRTQHENMTAVNVNPMLLVAFLLIGLVSAKSVSSDAYEVPRFRLSDLRNGRRASDLAHVLGTTGLLALTLDDDVKTSREVAAHRAVAFDGLCKCATPGQIHDAPLLSVPGTDSATLTDGVTVRTTLASATIGYTPLPLPAAELSSACGNSADTNFADALEGLRDAVAEASSAFINALDGVVSSPTNHPLVKTATGASYNSVRDVVGASKNLEHMHVYSRDNAEAMGREDVLQLHTDAGLFLSFIPASFCTNIKGLENIDRSFQVLDPHDGQVKVAVFPQDVPSVVIMLGIGAEQWLNTGDQSQNIKLKATRHKVSSMNSGERRAWYGMSKSMV